MPILRAEIAITCLSLTKYPKRESKKTICGMTSRMMSERVLFRILFHMLRQRPKNMCDMATMMANFILNVFKKVILFVARSQAGSIPM